MPDPAATEIHDLLRRLAALPLPGVADLEQVLDVRLTSVEDANPYFDFFEFEGARAPLPNGSFRVGLERPKALLTLRSAKGESIAESDLELDRHFGRPDQIDISPDAPPEGAVAYRYVIGGVSVWGEFATQSKVLVAISIHWGYP